MLRLCPHHGLEKWLIIHTFYNGILYTTKIYVDEVVGGALMNKTYTTSYALIEDMAQNQYQWTCERATTVVAPSPSKKEVSMYEASALDHFNAKVDTLFQKIDKLSVSVVTPAPVSPTCEVCGIFGHIGVECQLGSVVCNQGIKPNQNFYNQTPQNPFGQTTPLGYANNQRILQKSSLELFLENCIMDQSKRYEELKSQTGFLNDSLTKITSKVDSISTHNKILETQISQVAQQMVAPSQTTEVFPCQTETNPKDHISVITLRDGKQLEDSAVKVKNSEGEIWSD